MLVFDVANKNSFENLGSWVKEFNEHGGKGAAMVVVANKVGFIRVIHTSS